MNPHGTRTCHAQQWPTPPSPSVSQFHSAIIFPFNSFYLHPRLPFDSYRQHSQELPVKSPSISQLIPPPSHQIVTTKSVTPTIQIISHLEINIPASTGSVIIIVSLTILIQLLIIILTKNN